MCVWERPRLNHLSDKSKDMYHNRSVCCRMSINFMVSRSRDIAFHMNPRVREGIVVRNSMIGGNWGQEDTELSMNPFMEGQYFDVSICHIVFILSPSDEFTCKFFIILTQCGSAVS